VTCSAVGLVTVCLRFVLIGYVASQLMMNLSQKNMPFIGNALLAHVANSDSSWIKFRDENLKTVFT